MPENNPELKRFALYRVTTFQVVSFTRGKLDTFRGKLKLNRDALVATLVINLLLAILRAPYTYSNSITFADSQGHAHRRLRTSVGK